MAKDKETKKVNVTTVDEDNVMDQIRKGNLMPTTLHEKVKAEMEQEKEEKQKRLLKNAIGKATYEQRRTLLQLRARRREDKITKEKLTRASELLDKLTRSRAITSTSLWTRRSSLLQLSTRPSLKSSIRTSRTRLTRATKL